MYCVSVATRAREMLNNQWRLVLLLLHTFSLFTNGTVIFNEIMYHPKQGMQLEYLELFNPTEELISLANYTITDGIQFEFPEHAAIPSQGYVVVAKSKADLLSKYDLNPSLVYGDFIGDLSNSGEFITLLIKRTQEIITQIYYKDSWARLTDGFGPSLELTCISGNVTDKKYWRASPLPGTSDSKLEYSGTPGMPNSWKSCPPELPLYAQGLSISAPQQTQSQADVLESLTPTASVLFTEIMYHPVDEITQEEVHEYIELYNYGDKAVQLDNWKIVSDAELGRVYFSIPEGTFIDPNAHLIIAKNKTKFLEVYTDVGNNIVIGNYLGELSNGGGKLVLLDDNENVLEYVQYDDEFPWPIVADAFGASGRWVGDVTQHKFKGYSLHRKSGAISGSAFYNWEAGLPTPGRSSVTTSTDITPGIAEIFTVPAKNIIRSSDAVKIVVSLEPLSSQIEKITLQYYVYMTCCPLQHPEPSIVSVDMSISNEYIQMDRVYYSATLPKQSDSTVIRYSIKVVMVGGEEILSPRREDPFQWHAYFVTPINPQTATPVYRIFITQPRWDRLWENVRGGICGAVQVPDCARCNYTEERWQEEVPIVFVYNGDVIDGFGRYQGSAYSRMQGEEIASWPPDSGTPPSDPGTPPVAHSWRVKLPRYAEIDGFGGRSDLLLNKMFQGCAYISDSVTYTLAREVGLPAARTRFARLYVNNGYYRYVMDTEMVDDKLVERYHKSFYNTHCPLQSSEPTGHMFKASGWGDSPRGVATMVTLSPMCNFSSVQRYQLSYRRRTNKNWGTHDDFVTMINELQSIPLFPEGNPEAKNWFHRFYDVNFMLSYIALLNYAGAWDDYDGNYAIYQRLSDKKWTLTPWDADLMWGETGLCLEVGPSCTLYFGEEMPDQWWNILKDAFIKTFRPELNERAALLAATVLSPEHVNATLYSVLQQVNETEMIESGSSYGWGNNVSKCVGRFTTFQIARNAYILQQYTPPQNLALTVCPSRSSTSTLLHNSFTSAPGTAYPPVPRERTQTSLTLEWYPPKSHGSEINNYILERSTTENKEFVAIYTGTETQFKDEGLQPGTQYTYRLKASNSIGTGPFSKHIIISTAPIVTFGNLKFRVLFLKSNQDELMITEIMFNAKSEWIIDGSEFEFIELKNIGDADLDLSTVHFSEGIEFGFPFGTVLTPKETVVIARNTTMFIQRYGIQPNGTFQGGLKNGGEQITLATPIFNISSLHYLPSLPWPQAVDGHSLVPVSWTSKLDQSDPSNWRLSFVEGGSPGRDDEFGATTLSSTVAQPSKTVAQPSKEAGEPVSGGSDNRHQSPMLLLSVLLAIASFLIY